MKNYTFLIDTDNNEETIYFAIPADKIETLKVSDTYDRNGQQVSPEDAGDSVILLTQKAVDVVNSSSLNNGEYYVFINDNQPEMNCIANSEEDIKNFVESEWDTEWEEIKDINDVTQFYEGGDISYFGDSEYTNLVENAYKIDDYVNAHENSDIFTAILDECEEDVDYTLQAETCEGFNYWDGNNWKSIILSYEHNDQYTNWAILDDEDLTKELNEAIESATFISESFGTKNYETEQYNVIQTAFASDWSTYQVLAK